MNEIFLGKIKNSDDRDCVKYIKINGFECEHYFGGINICGACFSGFEKELKDFINKDYNSFDTILTKNELDRIFTFNKEIKDLGYGIKRGDDRYKKGIKLYDDIQDIIDKLNSEENENKFKSIIVEEKEYCKEKYDLTQEEIDEVFNGYCLPYQDRGIISCVYEDRCEFVEEEKFQYGYEHVPYFNDEEFAYDLLGEDNCLELENGKIITYNL